MMPLGLLQADESAEVVEIKSGNTSVSGHSLKGTPARNAQCRLEEMGLRAGKIVMVLNNEGRGPLLLKIDELRIAVSRGMAMHIIVRRIEV